MGDFKVPSSQGDASGVRQIEATLVANTDFSSLSLQWELVVDTTYSDCTVNTITPITQTTVPATTLAAV